MRIYAAVAAAVGWFALVVQLILIVNSDSDISSAGRIVNFFSYFTILSNILVATALTATAYGATRSALVWPSVQTAIALYIGVTLVTYFFVLRPLTVDFTGWNRAADWLLHYVMPILYLLFWVLFVKKGGLSYRSIPWFLIFPIGYAIYTLIRGPGVDWYPYPFLDASALTTGALIGNIAGMVFLFVVAAFALVTIGRGIGRVAPA